MAVSSSYHAIHSGYARRLGWNRMNLLLLLLLQGASVSHAFLSAAASRQKNVRSPSCLRVQTKESQSALQHDTYNSTSSSSSASFGSMLIQLQKEEEELKAINKETAPMEVLELEVGAEHNATTDGSAAVVVQEETLVPPPPPPARAPSDLLPSMSWEEAKGLDDAVTVLSSDNQPDMEVLPLQPLYQGLLDKDAQDDLDDMKLSRPEHYQTRVDRDLRHLAVSIASSTQDVQQWRQFCEEKKGGLFPLLLTVREGARSILLQKGQQPSAVDHTSHPVDQETAWLGSQEQYQSSGTKEDGFHPEETFQAACSACRALRDLCAISPEMAAVITDGILRANAAWGGALMADFCTMLEYANEYTERDTKSNGPAGVASKVFGRRRRIVREGRLRCKLYVTQLLLAMTVASDRSLAAIRSTEGLTKAIVASSSYARKEQTRRWLRYPGELVKWLYRSKTEKNADSLRRPFLEANNLANDLKGQVQRTANQVLAAIGYNKFIPKIPGQKGLRILSLDGGGSRGMAAVTAVRCLVEGIGNGSEVADSFDMICGTSTGGIIAFLVGLRRETSQQAVERYNQLVQQIFIKSALSTPLMLFTTASYDESRFMKVLSNILQDDNMLDSRADPAVPLVFAVTSKMSSTPTHVALFRNYNYAGGELADPFVIDPDKAREDTGISLDMENELIRSGQYPREVAENTQPGVRVSDGSRHPGSFRVLQRYALRASTAAPTVFKPVMMGGEVFADGGIVASNPAAVAIHEAKSLFPDVPIELVVSVGTGAFLEQKAAPRIGWDGIIGQIVSSACDGEQTHHILEDILGDGESSGKKSSVSGTRYYRFNPVIGLPDEFPIDVTDPEKLTKLKQITRDYMNDPVQKVKVEEIRDIVTGSRRWRKWIPFARSRA